MILANETRGTVLADELELARSTWTRFVGLMGRRDLPDGQALVLEPGNSIHMFFMRFAIDAVFVDRNWNVLHVAYGIKPWHVSRFVPKSRRVIEMPAGTCQRTDTRVGDRLSLGERSQARRELRATG
ncbi:MAG TPA: DUF192 domain-containing protein [Chloroflexota bacterium]|jgi:hypothetical protein|nr:DUF192 domain-containing protein [Chloroflexota bacterium]